MLANLLKSSLPRQLRLIYSQRVLATTPSITLPALIRSGDLVVMLSMAVTASGSPTDGSLPSGWTNVGDLLSGFGAVRSFFRIADATTAGSTITGFSAAAPGAGQLVCLVFRYGNSNILSAAAYSHAVQITDANPTQQTVTSGSGNVPVVIFAVARNAANTGFSVFSPAPDGGELTGSTDLYAYKIMNKSPVNTAINIPDGGTYNILQSFYIEVS